MLAVRDAGHDDEVGLEGDDALEVERGGPADARDLGGVDGVVAERVVRRADERAAGQLPRVGKAAHARHDALVALDGHLAAEVVREGVGLALLGLAGLCLARLRRTERGARRRRVVARSGSRAAGGQGKKRRRKKGRKGQGQKATSGRGLLHDRESSLLLVDGAGLGPPRCVMAAGPRARGLRIPFGWREGSRGRACRGLPRPPPRGAGPASRPARRPQAGATRGFPP